MKSLIELTQNLFHDNASLLAQVEYSYSSQGKPPGPVFWICYTAYAILIIAAWWKIFSKAGQAGWAAIIPIYNWIVWCKIVDRPALWVLLLLIFFPIFFMILSVVLAISFLYFVVFAICLLLLWNIFFPILVFGIASYRVLSVTCK